MTGLVLKYLENDIGGLANMQKINEAKAKVLYDYLDGQEFFTKMCIRDSLGTDKAALNHLLNHYFKGLAVPLEQSEQQPRQHGKNHQQGRCTVGKIVPGQKIKRSAR